MRNDLTKHWLLAASTLAMVTCADVRAQSVPVTIVSPSGTLYSVTADPDSSAEADVLNHTYGEIVDYVTNAAGFVTAFWVTSPIGVVRIDIDNPTAAITNLVKDAKERHLNVRLSHTVIGGKNSLNWVDVQYPSPTGAGLTWSNSVVPGHSASAGGTIGGGRTQCYPACYQFGTSCCHSGYSVTQIHSGPARLSHHADDSGQGAGQDGDSPHESNAGGRLNAAASEASDPGPMWSAGWAAPLPSPRPYASPGAECGQTHCSGEVGTANCYACCDLHCGSEATVCQDWCDDRLAVALIVAVADCPQSELPLDCMDSCAEIDCVAPCFSAFGCQVLGKAVIAVGASTGSVLSAEPPEDAPHPAMCYQITPDRATCEQCCVDFFLDSAGREVAWLSACMERCGGTAKAVPSNEIVDGEPRDRAATSLPASVPCVPGESWVVTVVNEDTCVLVTYECSAEGSRMRWSEPCPVLVGAQQER